MSSPIVTMSLLKYKGFSNKFWAFTMMQFAHKYLKNTDGLKFYKLMGTGSGNGFKVSADFSTYSLLTVWETEEQADEFLNNGKLHKLYREKSIEQYTVYMHPIKSHGLWSKQNPFKPEADVPGDYTAVITRATIATKHLIRFWRYVPGTSKTLEKYDGLIYAKGVGEWPIKQMATFSMWKDEKSMLDYAYKNHEHMKVVKKTRELNWYSEELFSRFRPFKSVGTWQGERLLPF